MKRMTETGARRFAIFLLCADIFIQCFYIFYTGSETWFGLYVWINEHGMYNCALLYCLLQAVFGEGLIWGVFGLLMIAISYLTALAALLFGKKRLYFLSILITAVDMVSALCLFKTTMIHVGGLLVKLIACGVYVLLMVETRKNAEVTV